MQIVLFVFLHCYIQERAIFQTSALNRSTESGFMKQGRIQTISLSLQSCKVSDLAGGCDSFRGGSRGNSGCCCHPLLPPAIAGDSSTPNIVLLIAFHNNLCRPSIRVCVCVCACVCVRPKKFVRLCPPPLLEKPGYATRLVVISNISSSSIRGRSVSIFFV